MSTGTVPFNFPPERSMEIGELTTGTSINNAGNVPTTTFFTAPIDGVYGLNFLFKVTATDGAGTVNISVTVPGFGTITNGRPVTSDFQMAVSPIWFSRGMTATVSVTGTGVTGTVYNLYLSTRRLF